MKERMQKTLSQVNGCPQRNRSETEWYGGVQTFMWMYEDNIVEVPFDKMSCEQLLPWLLTNKDELILSLMDGLLKADL